MRSVYTAYGRATYMYVDARRPTSTQGTTDAKLCYLLLLSMGIIAFVIRTATDGNATQHAARIEPSSTCAACLHPLWQAELTYIRK